MNLIEVMQRFPTQEACIEHLERIRWGNIPYCPHCGSISVAHKNESQDEGKRDGQDVTSATTATLPSK